MMSPQMIRQLSRQAARESQRNHVEPLAIEAHDLGVLDEHLRHIPFLGDRCPRGWKRVPASTLEVPERALTPYWGEERHKYFMVDSSGYGSPTEPALRFDQFCQWASEHAEGYGLAIVEQGQFQIVVGIFKKRQ